MSYLLQNNSIADSMRLVYFVSLNSYLIHRTTVLHRVLDLIATERVGRVGRTHGAYCAVEGVQSIPRFNNGKQMVKFNCVSF